MTPEELKEGCLYRIHGLSRIGPMIYLGTFAKETTQTKLYGFCLVNKPQDVKYYRYSEVMDSIREL